MDEWDITSNILVVIAIDSNSINDERDGSEQQLLSERDKRECNLNFDGSPQVQHVGTAHSRGRRTNMFMS
jgi:hypothetical protein